MSSPYHPCDGSRSTPRSSPPRSRLSSSHNAARLNGYPRTPFRSSVNGDVRESPSRQLVEEFSKVVLDEERHFRQSLDLQTAEQERRHQQALAEALAKHEAVRQSAERARERLEVQIRREQKAREEAERRAVEEEKRKEAAEEAERQKRRLEDERRREEERKQQAELKRQQEEHARQVEAQKQREEQEEVERNKREQEGADRKRREEAAARERARQAQQPQPPPPAAPAAQSTASTSLSNGTNPAAAQPQVSAQQPQTSTTAASAAAQRLTTTVEERKAIHQQYLALHQRLKTFRADCETQCKAAGFKGLGDMRRTIRAELGKLNKVVRDENKKRLAAIDTVFTAARTIPNAPIIPDIREFIVRTPQNSTALESATDTTYPMIPLYLLHQTAKSAIARLITESGSDPETADPIGIALVQIFSKPEYRWNNLSLIDLLWAKYRIRCPWLFGIPGPSSPDEEFHRMLTGLSAGYSALTLRDFSRSRNQNPAPNTMWWTTMAQTLNTPPGQTTGTQYVMLKALIENSVPRILQIFGAAGLALLRRSVRDFVQRGPRTREGRLRPEVVAVEALQVTLQEKYHISL